MRNIEFNLEEFCQSNQKLKDFSFEQKANILTENYIYIIENKKDLIPISSIPFDKITVKLLRAYLKRVEELYSQKYKKPFKNFLDKHKEKEIIKTFFNSEEFKALFKGQNQLKLIEVIGLFPKELLNFDNTFCSIYSFSRESSMLHGKKSLKESLDRIEDKKQVILNHIPSHCFTEEVILKMFDYYPHLIPYVDCELIFSKDLYFYPFFPSYQTESRVKNKVSFKEFILSYYLDNPHKLVFLPTEYFEEDFVEKLKERYSDKPIWKNIEECFSNKQ